MRPEPLVSVVTPSLNQADFIEETIQSVATQGYPRREHIVVDGGSSDGTLDILRRYPHVRWVSEADDGQSDAINKGFAMARGEVLAWLNADDYYLSDAIAQAVAELRASGCGIVYADVMRVDDDGRNPRRIAARRPFDLWMELNVGCGIRQPAVFFTREAFDAVGGLDVELHYGLDYDLWLRIAERYEVRSVDAVWATERMHRAAKSVAQMDRFWPEVRRASREHGGRLLSPMYLRHLGIRSRIADRAVAGLYMLLEGRLLTLLRRIVAVPRG